MNPSELATTLLGRLDLLVPLLVSHFLADFTFLQSDRMVADKRRGLRSGGLWLHACLAALLAWGLLWRPEDWWIFPIVFVTHLLLDTVKSSLRDDLSTFLGDQFLHLLVLVCVVLGITRLHPELPARSPHPIFSILLVCLLLWPVAGRIIDKATMPWRERLAGVAKGVTDLPNAGLWIGYLERTLTLFFVMLGRWEGIGFLIAAKSIFRFAGDRPRMESEYFLFGTLLSFALALAAGLLARFLLF